MEQVGKRIYEIIVAEIDEQQNKTKVFAESKDKTVVCKDDMLISEQHKQ